MKHSFKRILLTGGAGSIGIHVIAHLMHNTVWDVVVLDSFRHKGFHERIQLLRDAHPEWNNRWSVFQHDLCCPLSEKLVKDIGGIDIVLHLAALSDVGFSIDNPVYTIQNNITSTLTMLEFARQHRVEHFIYFSTDEVYGPVKSGEAHPEWDTHRPSNAYSASKAASEDICYAYWRSYGIPLTITNTMNNFGEMQSPSKFPVIVQKKLEAGETVTIHGNHLEMGTRYYIHSRNVADALIFILEQGPRYHEMGMIDSPHRYHIVGDACVSNLEMAEMIAKIMDKKLKYKIEDFHIDNPGHDIHYGLQDNNLRSKGWEEPVPFTESLENTIKWQQEHPDWIQ